MKKIYFSPVEEIIIISTDDIITTSPGDTGFKPNPDGSIDLPDISFGQQ